MPDISHSISFVMDGEVVDLDFSHKGIGPTTTVLNYLRSRSDHKGVKEGCAEGDCGACTVVLGELDNGKIRYTSIDSCLVFLPMLQGKQIITVENLGSSDSLHPVQEAMVATDGSQCGFCTPGIVMSIFELYKNKNKPSREDIEDGLTGNLCRCTGYRSIVEAAAISCVKNGKDHFSKTEAITVQLLKKIKKEPKHLRTQKQNYFIPATINEAIALKKKHPKALLLGGATDLALRVTKNHELLSCIIDLGNIAALKKVTQTKTQLSFGSGVSLETIKNACKDQYPAAYKMLAVFGSKQIRNLATLGGNLGSASPIGDMPPVLMAYNASLTLAGANGKRKVSMCDFITGYRATVLKNDEIIQEISLPLPKVAARISSYKISKRKDLDISTVSGGFRLEFNTDKRIRSINLNYGGMAAMTKNAAKAEEYLKGKAWTRENVEKAMEIIEDDFTPISDARSGKKARMIMAKNLLMKFWTENQTL
jgi:xanthine dehydrogenase small subunit